MLSFRKKSIYIVIVLIILNTFVFKYCNTKMDSTYNMELNFQGSQKFETQVFYATDYNFKDEESIKKYYENYGKRQRIKYSIKNDKKNYIRVGFSKVDEKIIISNLNIIYKNKEIEIPIETMYKAIIWKNEIAKMKLQNNKIIIEDSGDDPYFVFDNLKVLDIDRFIKEVESKNSLSVKIVIASVVNLLGILFIFNLDKIIQLPLELYKNKNLIFSLAKNDFKTKYAGSYLGIIWAFIQPVVTVLVYWFVFQIGFKSQPIKDYPFILWLVSGLVPWFFFSEALMNATNSFIEYSYLVKKVVFKISILPIVKIMSALFVHCFFIGFMFFMYALYGKLDNVTNFQIIYYTICVFALVLSISFIMSSVIIFFKDLGQIINIALQIGMWMTPIMWPYTMVSENYRWILKLNPMYYIVEGYRDSLINHIWFWDRYMQTAYFWILVLSLFFLGTIVFKKLRIHFSDVL